MDMLMGMLQGGMVGNGMEEVMNQETQDVIIKMKSSGQQRQIGKENKYTEMML